ncbi:ATP-binding protein [Nocardia sp. NBC_00881]|uniref:AAA family ATPase n=1 Tax=Nocardia sp. NBC_00881 TaxID=2975995 RepID=UPI00386944A4|nr:ATP-binding protein [Nocardia sp. NBC_00881]
MPKESRLGTLDGVKPSLEAPPIHAPEPLVSTLAPDSVHDLRGGLIEELRYPNSAALVVAGVPGAGKSTTLRRFFGATSNIETPRHGPDGAIVLDSHQARISLRRRLWWLPYPLWRPVVHTVHFLAIHAALRDTTGPVVIHDCATFRWTRVLIAHWAALYGRDLHLIMLDVPPTVARAGQYARGRRVNGVAFTLHVRRWRRLMRTITIERRRPTDGSRSVVIVDRATVNRMRRVKFVA